MNNYLNSFRLYRATKNTIDGLKILWCKEQAFRQEIYVSIILIPIIFFLSISPTLKLLLILLLFFLLLVETINSAIEVIIDRISLDINPQSKMAKDMGSAAVAIAILMNMIAWVYSLLNIYS